MRCRNCDQQWFDCHCPYYDETLMVGHDAPHFKYEPPKATWEQIAFMFYETCTCQQHTCRCCVAYHQAHETIQSTLPL